MNKRIKLAAITTSIAALAAGGIIYAMPDKKPTTQLSTQPTTTQAEVTPTNAQPTATQTVEPAPAPVVPAPAPAETVDSVLAAETWEYDNDRECVNIIRENKPELFTTVESTKKLISVLKKSYTTPCSVVSFGSRQLVTNYWQKIERQL